MGTNAIYNIPHVKLYGAELEASIKLKRFWATFSYMYEDHKIDKTGLEKEWTYYLIQLLPYHRAKLIGAYQIFKNGWIKFSAKYVGDRKSQKIISGKRETLADYVVIDGEYEQSFKLKNFNASLGIFINNLTRTSYQEISGFEMPKQVVGVNFKVKF